MGDGMEQWEHLAWYWYWKGVSCACQQTGSLVAGIACLVQGRFHLLVPYCTQSRRDRPVTGAKQTKQAVTQVQATSPRVINTVVWAIASTKNVM